MSAVRSAVPPPPAAPPPAHPRRGSADPRPRRPVEGAAAWSAGRTGAIHTRAPWQARFNAWRKRTPLNPYWLDWIHLVRSIERLAPEACGWMLDVGVAQRPYARFFAPYVERYVGLDYPPALLAKQPSLWQILDRARMVLDLFGDGTRLPFATGSFQTVFCTEVLEHLPEPARCVEEMARVLEPGGRLLLTVPFFQPLHELPGDYGRFTEASLRHVLEGAGLEVTALEPRGNTAAALGAGLSQFLLRTLGAKGELPDGSVVVSPLRSALTVPLTALVQTAFWALSRVARDGSCPQGWTVVARKPAAVAVRAAAAAGAHEPATADALRAEALRA